MVKPTLNQESSCNANNPIPQFFFFFSIISYVELPCKGEPTPAGIYGQVALLANSLIHQTQGQSITLPTQHRFYGAWSDWQELDKEIEKGCREQRWWRPH